jgi:hypothetical protein
MPVGQSLGENVNEIEEWRYEDRDVEGEIAVIIVIVVYSPLMSLGQCSSHRKVNSRPDGYSPDLSLPCSAMCDDKLSVTWRQRVVMNRVSWVR